MDKLIALPFDMWKSKNLKFWTKDKMLAVIVSIEEGASMEPVRT